MIKYHDVSINEIIYTLMIINDTVNFGNQYFLIPM